LKARVQFVTVDAATATAIDDYVDEREFVRIPCVGEFVTTGVSGEPLYLVLGVTHAAIDDQAPSATVHVGRISIPDLSKIISDRVVHYLS
jgi:hypothetical protein